jgi:hypothetical protein
MINFKDYTFKIEVSDVDNFDSLCDAVDVILTTKEGKRYSALFRGAKFLNYIFEKNKRTGECANGTYFATAQNPVEVEEINERNVRIAIDELIENLEMEKHFEKID